MKQVYNKPYIEKIGSPTSAYFHYDRDAAEPIIPYLVLDGGAFMFMRDRFKIENTNQLLELIMSGEFFKLWEYDGKFDWDTVFKLPKQDTMRNFEWHLFLQRLYFLMPLAVRFYKTKDNKYADKFYELLTDWMEKHPYEEFDCKISRFETGFYWRDMQVAWRTIVLCISCYFLDDAFDEEKWQYIYSVIRLHADHLLEEALDHEKKGDAQNHVLQVGSALIYVGCLFGEFPNKNEYIRLGEIIVKQNLDKAIFDDGGSDEDSPSYSHFIARLYFDAYMLLKNNGYTAIDGVYESVKRQYELLYQMSTVKGQTVPFNDCYIMDAHNDIEIVESLCDIKVAKCKKSVAFNLSGLAVLRNENYEVFVDAMPHTAWHQHAGRPNVAIYYKGKPIVIDSGACNYDRQNLRDYFISHGAHNAVFAEEIDNEFYKNIEDSYEFEEFEDNKIVIVGRVKTEDVSYTTRRTILLGDKCVKITDTAIGDKEYDFRLNMHLTGARYIDEKAELTQLLNENVLNVKCPVGHTVALNPCMSNENVIDVSVTVGYAEKCKNFKSEFEFQIDETEI